MLTAYVKHYNTARPHRGNHLDVPAPAAKPVTERLGQIERLDVLGGLIHAYRRAA